MRLKNKRKWMALIKRIIQRQEVAKMAVKMTRDMLHAPSFASIILDSYKPGWREEDNT